LAHLPLVFIFISPPGIINNTLPSTNSLKLIILIFAHTHSYSEVRKNYSENSFFNLSRLKVFCRLIFLLLRARRIE
jgi:hypothetical protein